LISQFFTCVADESPVFLMAVVPTVVFFKCRRSPTAPRAPRAPRRKAWYCLVGFSNGTSAEGAQVVSLAVKKKTMTTGWPPPVISWFINHYKPHKGTECKTELGAPSCRYTPLSDRPKKIWPF
jgi:hypothetical protein